MSTVWMGFAQAQGVGHKVALVKTLTYGRTDIADISAVIYDGIGSESGHGIPIVIHDMVKVDFAHVSPISSANVVNCSGYQQPWANVHSYSANAFRVQLLTKISGADAVGSFSHFTLSGSNVSGVVFLKALVIGEAKRMVVE